MADLSQMSDADLLQLAQQSLNAPGQQPATPAPQPSVLDSLWSGIKGAANGAMTVLDLPAKIGYDLGGKVTDATGSPAAGYATDVATQAVPTMIGGLMKAGGQGLRWGAERLMQSAIKPSSADLISGKAARAVGTMLDNGVNVTPGGMNKLQQLGEAANAQASDAIAGSTAQVDKGAVASRLQSVYDKFTNQVNPQSDLNAIQDVDTNFLSHPSLSGQSTMPVQLAQDLKQGTYSALRGKYGEVGSASTEAQKALARGLKEEIESAVPDVAAPNAAASDIWNAHNVVNRRALIAGNNDPLSFAPLAADPSGAVAFLLNRSPLSKSLLARALNGVGSGMSAVGGAAVPATPVAASIAAANDQARRNAYISKLMGK